MSDSHSDVNSSLNPPPPTALIEDLVKRKFADVVGVDHKVKNAALKQYLL